MMMPVLRLLSLLRLHFSPPPRAFFLRGVGGRWIRGLRAQNPCAIGISPVHNRVDFRGLQWTPGKDESTKSNLALADTRSAVGELQLDAPVARGVHHRQRLVLAVARRRQPV